MASATRHVRKPLMEVPLDFDRGAATAYLRTYFLPMADFAAQCAIPVDTLAQLIDARVMPAPAYLVSSAGGLMSVGFGVLGPVDTTPGPYVHPGTRVWALRANTLVQGKGLGAARAEMRRQFVECYCRALALLDETAARLPDSFTATGKLCPDGALTRAETAWRGFTSGICGWQGADPSRVWSIARVHVLGEALVAFDHGSGSPPPHIMRRARGWLDDYLRAALPLTSVEAARCPHRLAARRLKTVLAE